VPDTLGIFDTGATTFAFNGTRPDLEQAVYVQDLIRLGNWTINAGLRWDHYQLEVNQNAVSPRLAISRYFPTLGQNIHGAFDRIFQTPSFENISLGNSPQRRRSTPAFPQCYCRLSLLTGTIPKRA
jgi:outer membrane receptor protein involved in Fe transport